jgi:hypothetical protein
MKLNEALNETEWRLKKLNEALNEIEWRLMKLNEATICLSPCLKDQTFEDTLLIICISFQKESVPFSLLMPFFFSTHAVPFHQNGDFFSDRRAIFSSDRE